MLEPPVPPRVEPPVPFVAEVPGVSPEFGLLEVSSEHETAARIRAAESTTKHGPER